MIVPYGKKEKPMALQVRSFEWPHLQSQRVTLFVRFPRDVHIPLCRSLRSLLRNGRSALRIRVGPVIPKSTTVLIVYSQGVVSVILVMPQFLDVFPQVSETASGAGFMKGLLTAMIQLGALIGLLPLVM